MIDLLCAGGGQVIVESTPWQPKLDQLRQATAALSPGGCIAYAIRLDLPPFARLAMLTMLRVTLWRVESAVSTAGARVVGRYGVDPNLDAPSFIYQLNTAAAAYADRCLRPPAPGTALRRCAATLFGCDPALGGVIVVGSKP